MVGNKAFPRQAGGLTFPYKKLASLPLRPQEPVFPDAWQIRLKGGISLAGRYRVVKKAQLPK
jgi:hypothetical protein